MLHHTGTYLYLLVRASNFNSFHDGSELENTAQPSIRSFDTARLVVLYEVAVSTPSQKLDGVQHLPAPHDSPVSSIIHRGLTARFTYSVEAFNNAFKLRIVILLLKLQPTKPASYHLVQN